MDPMYHHKKKRVVMEPAMEPKHFTKEEIKLAVQQVAIDKLNQSKAKGKKNVSK